jgi:hypothetical protein
MLESRPKDATPAPAASPTGAAIDWPLEPARTS